MAKRFLILVVLCFCSTTLSSVEIKGYSYIEELPYPYNTVIDLKPFVDHGWYQNAAQLHS